MHFKPRQLATKLLQSLNIKRINYNIFFWNWRCWFLWREEAWEPGEKPSLQGENQPQAQPTYDQNRTQVTLMAGEQSRCCAIPAPNIKCIYSGKLPGCSNIIIIIVFIQTSLLVYWQLSEIVLYREWGNGQSLKCPEMICVKAMLVLPFMSKIVHVVLAYT